MSHPAGLLPGEEWEGLLRAEKSMDFSGLYRGICDPFFLPQSEDSASPHERQIFTPIFRVKIRGIFRFAVLLFVICSQRRPGIQSAFLDLRHFVCRMPRRICRLKQDVPRVHFLINEHAPWNPIYIEETGHASRGERVKQIKKGPVFPGKYKERHGGKNRKTRRGIRLWTRIRETAGFRKCVSFMRPLEMSMTPCMAGGFQSGEPGSRIQLCAVISFKIDRRIIGKCIQATCLARSAVSDPTKRGLCAWITGVPSRHGFGAGFAAGKYQKSGNICLDFPGKYLLSGKSRPPETCICHHTPKN